jgi:hypothetical protein
MNIYSLDFQYNSSMRIHQRVLKPVFGSCLAVLFGRKTPSAVDNFFKAVDHHKGEQLKPYCTIFWFQLALLSFRSI